MGGWGSRLWSLGFKFWVSGFGASGVFKASHTLGGLPTPVIVTRRDNRV